MPGAGIPRDMEMLLLERGFPPWKWGLPHGGCCRSALPQEADEGWHFSQELNQAGGRGHGRTNPGAHLTRRKCPLGRKKQLCGKKKNQKKGDRQGKERSSWLLGDLCFHAHAEETLCWSKALGFPSWTQEKEGVKRSVLVIQPETEQMWEGTVRAG